MTIRPISKMGNQKLSTASLPVSEFSSKALKELVRDLQETMKEKGGVGIAAPQIACNLRVILFGFKESIRYPKERPIPLTLLINPVIEILSDEMEEGWEGCLSVPGLRGLVPRYKKIKYSGFDLDGKTICNQVEGFHARVVQHECDHIDGILFPQRIKNMQYFGFEDELKDIIWPQSL